jgi:hypothetical protein
MNHVFSGFIKIVGDNILPLACNSTSGENDFTNSSWLDLAVKTRTALTADSSHKLEVKISVEYISAKPYTHPHAPKLLP